MSALWSRTAGTRSAALRTAIRLIERAMARRIFWCVASWCLPTRTARIFGEVFVRGKGDEPCKLALCAEAMRGMQSEGYTDRVDGISAGERTRAAAQRPREAKSVNGTERGRERERERERETM